MEFDQVIVRSPTNNYSFYDFLTVSQMNIFSHTNIIVPFCVKLHVEPHTEGYINVENNWKMLECTQHTCD